MLAVKTVAVLVVAALIGCAPAATPSESPGSSASPTVEATGTTAPTAAPTSAVPSQAVQSDAPSTSLWAQHPPKPFLLGVATRVVVSELNIRGRPSVSAKRRGTVVRDNLLAVTGPPVEADGYIWYRGMLIESRTLPELPRPVVDVGDQLNGWFAARKGDTVYVRPIAARCPSVADFKNVSAMLEGEQVACFGNRTIELQGTFGCRGCLIEIFGDFDPGWLIDPNARTFIWEDPMEGWPLRLRFPPGGQQEPTEGSIVRVRGHFDDRAVATCSMAPDYPWDDAEDPHVVPDVIAHELCRQEFVVESYEILGTDPSF